MDVYKCVHRQRPHIGMSASWEPASATQIARSGAAATGTPAALVADQIGGAARSNQVQCRSHRVIGLCSAEQYPGAWVRCWASGDLLEMRAGAAPAPGCGLPAISPSR
jgi:hypothetical protein